MLYFERRRLIEPPLRPAACASSLVHLWAVPNACAALPPLLAISRFFSGLIEAKPRPRPFCTCMISSPFGLCVIFSFRVWRLSASSEMKYPFPKAQATQVSTVNYFLPDHHLDWWWLSFIDKHNRRLQ